MKTYILGILLSAFVFITVHDFVITYFDNDTQSELIMKAQGDIDAEQMCDISLVHESLHEMVLATDLVVECGVETMLIPENISSSYTLPYIGEVFQSLYRPPIA